MNGQAGELVICPRCGGKDWEIRFGPADGKPPPGVTCPGCLAMFWLEAYIAAPGSPCSISIHMVPVAEARGTRAPDYPPDG